MEQSLLLFIAHGRRGGGSADKAFTIEQEGDQPSLKGGYRKLTANEGGVCRILQSRMGRSGELFPSDTTRTLRPPPPQTLINLFFYNENCCVNSLKLVYFEFRTRGLLVA